MTVRRSLARPARQPVQRLALEPRIVFDGAAPVAAGAAVEHHESAPPAAHAPAVERIAAPQSEVDRVEPDGRPVERHPQRGTRAEGLRDPGDRPAAVSAAPADPSTREIAFVDASVVDIEAYLPGFKGQVVTIRSGSDGFDQIAAALAGQTGITAIHILGHGGAGSVSLGNGTLDATSIGTRYAADLAVISRALTPHGDILLYACDVAAGAGGQAFITQLASATGDDVAASTDSTGAASLGGNWVLEAHTGTIEARAIDASGWNGLLLAPVLNLGGTTNELLDGNFDGRTQPILNGDNVQGTTYGAFTTTGALIDVIRVNGTTYASGPDNANTGSQYVTLQGGGTISQSFTITTAQTVSFGASFGIANPLSFLASTETASIVDSNGNVVATALAVLAVTNNPETFTTTTNTAVLTAGTYSLVVQTGANVVVDSAFVTPGATYNTLYTPSAAPVPVAATSDSIVATLGPTLASATVTLTNPQTGDLLSKIGTVSAAITVSAYNTTTHAITLTGTDTLANYAAALTKIGFSNSTATPGAAQRTINVVVNDGTTNSNVAQNVVTVDYPPVANADSFSTPHNVPVTIDVRANDTDANGNTFTVDRVNGTLITVSSPVAVTGGIVSLTANGNLIFTPTTGYLGSPSFTYNVIDPLNAESAAATVSGTVTDQPPVIDLNSTSASNQDIVNGTFTGGAAGWTAAGNGTASNNYYYWDTDGGAGTLTQSGLTNLNRGYGTHGAAAVTFDLGWNNGSPDTTVPATLDLTVGGVLYARFTTNPTGGNGATAQVGTFTYFNGASGPVNSVTSSNYLNWSFTRLTVNLPSTVAATGNLVLSYSAGTGGYDDIAIDNVSVLTRTDPVAGVNYATSYTENAIPTSIASANAEAYDNDDTMLVSATVVITNAQAGDVLTQIALGSANITVSQYNEATHTVTLTGSDTAANYAAAIQTIGFANTSDNPSTTPRTINVTVNDGLTSSAVATTTVNVVAVNDAPVVNLSNNANLLVDGDFENNVQPNVNANNLKSLTYGAFTATSQINILRVDGTGYAPAPDYAYSGSQYLDLNGDGAISQTFTLSSAQTINFGGAFSNRQNDSTTYVAPATTIDILNSGGTVVATATGAALTRASGDENWYLSGGNVSLAAGTYTYRVTLGNFAQADALYVRNVSGYTSSYTENAVPTPIAGAGNSVTDLDNTTMTSATIVLTNAQSLDVLSVIGTLPTGITASAYNATTGTLTLSGTATSASYATAIAQVGFSSTSENPSATPRVIDVTVSDGTSTSNTAVATINVIPVNDPPVAVNDTITLTEDRPLDFNPRSNDTDPENDPLTIKQINGIAITPDSIGVNVTGGVVVMDYNGNLEFIPNSNFSGTGSFTYQIADPSGATSTATVTVNITPVNDAPVVDLNGPSAATTAPTADGNRDATPPSNAWDVLLYSGSFAVAGAAAPNNADRTTGGAAGTPVLNGEIYLGQDDAPLIIRDDFIQAGDKPQNVLIRSGNQYGGTYVANATNGDFNTAAGSVFQYVATRTMTAAGTITLGAPGSAIDDYAEIFVNGTRVAQNLTYTYNLAAPLTASFNAGDVVEIRLTNQGGPGAFTVDATITNINYATAYTENGAPLSIASSAIVVNDVDNATMASAMVTLTNAQAGDLLSVTGALPTGITASAYDASTGVLTLSGNASRASYATAIGQVGFSSTSENPSTTPRIVNTTVNDGSATSPVAVTTISVTAVNDAPTSTAPASVTSAEDTTLSFTGAAALTVSDVDSPNLTVSLNVSHGTLTLGTTTGLTFTSGNGAANASMVFSGTQAQLNSALASLTFRPNADYNGSDTLGFNTSDGALSTAKSIGLTITPVADITADTVTTSENSALSFNAITGTNGATPDTFSDPSRAVTSVTQGAHGSVSYNANGTLTYTPNANFFGTDTFNYTVTAGGTTETATETVNVTHVNQAPTSTAPTTVTSAEDTTLSFTGGNALTVNDVDNPNLTVTLNVAHGTLTLGTTTGLTFSTGNGSANAAMTFTGTQAQLNAALASLTYRPSPDFNGSDTLNFGTSDGSLSSARTVALTVTPVADIRADTVTTGENTAITFNAITGTNGATADTFSDPSRAMTAVGAAAHGNVAFNADGTLTYTPNTNYFGTDTFTYTVTAGGSTETATETVNVNFINQSPTSTAPGSVASPEDTTLAFTGTNRLSVLDIDSPSLTVTLNVAHGSLTLGTTTGLVFGTGNGTANASMTFSGTQAQLNNALSSLTYRPSPDYNGSDTLNFTTSDGSLNTAKAVALTVTPVADITADTVTTNENTAISFNAITGTNGATADTFSDPARAVTAVGAAGHGTVGYNANGVLTYTPNANYSGTDMFTYTVTAGGTTETATETVNVTFVNQAPTSTAPTAVASSEDTTLAFVNGNALSVNDVDTSNLSVTLSVTRGTLTLGTTTGLTFSTGTGTANTSMTFSGTQAQLNAALASLTFRPNADFNGNANLQFSTSDGALTTAKTVALTIAPVADITADSVATNENTVIAFNAITGTNGATADTFSDPSRAVTAVTQGAHGMVGYNADGTLTYTPNTNFFGTDTFNYTVTAGGTTETATETVTVRAVNQAPTSSAPTAITSNEDTTLAFTGGNALSAADVDSPNLTVSLNVGHGTLTLGTTTGLAFGTGNGTANASMTFTGTQAQVNNALASLTYRPSPDYNGSDTLNFNTSDGSLNSAKTVVLTLSPVADITADNVTTSQNMAVTFNAITGTNGATADTFSDPNRAVTAVTQGSNGSVTYNANGTLTYTPNTNFAGADTFTYTVTAGGTTETATETVTVGAVNQAPTSAAPTTVASAEDTTLAFTNANALTVNDVDSSNLTVTLNVAHGSLTLGTTTGLTFSNGNGTANASMTFSGTQAQLNTALASLTYRPSPDYNGADTLGFSTTDGALTSNRSVALTVTPVADITADTVSVNENSTISFDAILGTNGATADTFSDPNRAVTAVTQGTNGTVSYTAAGVLTYTPNTNYSGTDTFTYTVSAGGTTETATETVNVVFVNQTPTSAAPTTVNVTEDTTRGFRNGNALSVSDVDSPNLSVTLSVGHGTLTLGTTTGLTFITGTGTADTTMTFGGTQAQLNNALASLNYRSNPDFNGSDTLAFTTSDGSTSAVKNIALTIAPVADITADSVTTNENAVIVFNAITGTNGATADAFSDPNRAVTAVTQGAHGTVSFNADGTLTYTPNANFSGTDTFTYTVTAGGTTETATETVTVNFVDQAPTSTAPTAISSAEDTTLVFTNGNALSVADVDNPNLTVTLNVGHGTLTLGTTTGLTFSTGNGTANTSMTFSGTQAQLNTALASLTYRPGPDFNGSDTLGFSTSDGSITTTKSTALTISPVADITADSVTTNENAAIVFNAITGTNGATADTFSDPNRAVTSVTQGAHGTVSFNADGTFTYTPNTNFYGTDTFNYTVTAGGTTETATETVMVDFVNQAPTSTAPTTVTSAEDTTIAFSGGNALMVGDVDNPGLTVSLNVSHGTLTLGTTTGLTFTTGNGAANGAMTFSGTQAQLNAALASLTFRPDPDYNGSAVLGFNTSDGSLTTAKSIALTITPVADITADGITTNENTAISFNAITGTNGATPDTFSDPNRAVVAVTQGVNGTVTFTAAGVLTYTPNANFFGSDSYSYTVMAGGSTETAAVSMTVVHVNQAPVANNDSFTAAENAIATIDVRANDTDADSDPLTVTQINGQAIIAGGTGVAVTGGTITLGTDGNLVYTPTANYRGSTSFTYTVADPFGASSTATVAGTIAPVNHAPVAGNDAATIDEDHDTAGNVLANDSDIDGDTLTVAAVNGNAGGVGTGVAGSNGGIFTIQPNGSYTFATNGQFEDLGTGQSRTTTVTYTAADGHGGTSTATVTVTVTGVNDAPVANPDSFDTTDTSGPPSGVSLSNNVLTNDTDAEHDAITVSAVNGNTALVGVPAIGSYGTLTLGSDGTFTYAVDRTNVAVLALTRGQAPLIDQFTYTASDGHGGTGSTTLTVRVQGTNDGPMAGNDSNMVGVGQTGASGNVISGARTDGDGTTTTVIAAMDVEPGFTLNVNAIRLPGETTGAAVGSTTTASRTGMFGTLTIDASGNYSYALNNNSAAAQALIPGEAATDSFVYTVTDGARTTEATITVSVNGRNQPPVAQNDSFTTAEGNSVAIDVRANDSDPNHDPIRVTAVDGTAVLAGGASVSVTGGTVALNTSGDLVYTPDPYYRGSPSFTYTIQDPSGATATATVSGTITPVNHAPTAVADTFSTAENTAAPIDVLANDSDVDGDALTVTQVNGNAITAGGSGVTVAGGVVMLSTSGGLVFTPATNFTGPASFSYTISDPSGATSSATVSGNVAHVNQAPIAVDDQFTSPQGTTAIIDVRANDHDPEGDALTITQVDGVSITAGGPAVAVTGGSVVLDTAGKLEFTPTGTYRGATSFGYTVSDPFGATGSATVRGTVTATNHAPVANPDSFSVTQGSTATIDARANDTDADGDPLTITQVNGTAIAAGGPAIAVTGGTVALDAAGRLVFTPTAGYVGPTTFSYVVADPSGATSTASINGTVSPASNHAPVANPDSFTSAANTPATIDVRSNDTDADNDPLTVTQVNGTSITAGSAGVAVTGGVVTLAGNGSLVFTPTAGFAGSTSFSYTVSDPSGATGTATVSGTIASAGNHAPVAVGDAFTISANTVAVVDVRANDADVDGDPLTVTQINGTPITSGGPGVAVTGGLVTLDAFGNVVFTPAAGYAGNPSFTYTVRDPSGATSMASVSGTVTRGLHEPVAMPDTAGIAENAGPTIVDVRANDTDANGDPLTITQINGMPVAAGGSGVAVAGGTVALDANGNLVFTPTANVNGPVSFTYTISDSAGSRSSATASIDVTPAAHAPMAVADTFNVAENGGPVMLAVRANDVDTDNNPLTITKINGTTISPNGPAVAVTGGSVTLDAAGNLFFTVTANTNGPVAFSYTVADPAGSSSTAGVSVNVAPAAHAPVAMPDSFTVGENAAATVLPVRANDVDIDGNPLTITRINGQAIVAGGPGIAVPGGVVNLDVAGKLLFLPTANLNGPVTFSYTISDPAGSLSTANVTVDVTPLDIGPVARPDRASGAGSVTVDVLANDTDASGTIDRTSVQLGGTARPGDPLVVPNQGTFTIDPTTGAITFTPVAGFVGTATASYTVADSNGLRSAAAPLSTTIVASNHAPVANPDRFTVAENGTTTINVLANDTDAEGDPLTITQVNGQAIVAGGPAVATAAGSFTLDAAGNLHFTPTPNSSGPVSFTYTVRDPSGATATGAVGGSVTPVAGTPVAAGDVAYGEPGAPIVVDVLANDHPVAGDPVTITAIDGYAITAGGPGVAIPGGVVTLDNDGNLHFVPAASSGTLAETSFTYTITSASGASSTAGVQLILNGVTNPPTSADASSGAPSPTSSRPAASAPSVVLLSVDGIRVEAGLLDTYGGFITDVATEADIGGNLGDGLGIADANPLDGVGLIPRGVDRFATTANAHADSLYVQHAVRHEDLATTDALYVQHAVRQSQAESRLRDLRASTLYDATVGGATLFDPFAVGAAGLRAAPERPADDRRPEAHPGKRDGTHAHHAERATTPIAERTEGPVNPPEIRDGQSGFTAQLRQSARGLRTKVAARHRLVAIATAASTATTPEPADRAVSPDSPTTP